MLSSAGIAVLQNPQKKGTPVPPPLSSDAAIQGSPTLVSLAELMGAEVQLEGAAADKAPAADASRGKVAELVVSTHGGEIVCAALSVGKLVGGSDKIVLVPMTAVKPAMVDKRPGFALRMTKAEIEALPPFEIRKAESEGLDKAVEQARGLGTGGAAPKSKEPPGKEAGEKEGGQDPIDPKGPAGARGAPGKAGAPEYVLSGMLRNCAVEASDKECGKVQDAAVELGTNAVGYLIVSRSEAAGGGAGLMLVPYRACQWTHAESKEALKLGKSIEQLKAAPEYKKPEKTIATADQMRAADGFFGGKAGFGNPQ
jgi:sporulation protein YlmC with PRC-barrel domain